MSNSLSLVRSLRPTSSLSNTSANANLLGFRALTFAAWVVVLVLAGGMIPHASSVAFAQDGEAPTPNSVNINTADADAIASTLKGVGNARAQEIVRYREQYGPFVSVDELTDVKGIGKSTLEDNRARITLE